MASTFENAVQFKQAFDEYNNSEGETQYLSGHDVPLYLNYEGALYLDPDNNKRQDENSINGIYSALLDDMIRETSMAWANDDILGNCEIVDEYMNGTEFWHVFAIYMVRRSFIAMQKVAYDISKNHLSVSGDSEIKLEDALSLRTKFNKRQKDFPEFPELEEGISLKYESMEYGATSVRDDLESEDYTYSALLDALSCAIGNCLIPKPFNKTVPLYMQIGQITMFIERKKHL